MRLPDGEGLRVVEHINQKGLDVPVAVITAFGSAENAVAALKAGAFDYLAKPVALEQLRALVKQALKVPEKTQPASSYNLLGESPAMQQVRGLIERLAKSQAPVFINGESGSGKELAARTIHLHGPRGEQPFVAVNCGAIPENLMESEFFGYRKGAFTGAEADRDGFFQAANGGTLFLDEVADLPLAMQVKLLRAIQEKKVRKVGATQEEPVDVRIISATHKKLGALVDSGHFRQDLYYRLHVIELRDAQPARNARGHSADRQRDPAEADARWRARNSSPKRSRRSSTIRFRATCASWRTSSSAGCRWPPIRCASPRRTCTSRPWPTSPTAHAAGREVAAAGLPRPRRTHGDQRSAGKDALQPHRGGETARASPFARCATGWSGWGSSERRTSRPCRRRRRMGSCGGADSFSEPGRAAAGNRAVIGCRPRHFGCRPACSAATASFASSPTRSTRPRIRTSRRSRDLRVSAHFFIRRNGALIQFVSVHRRAHGTRASRPGAGANGCNDFSLGIELEGADDVPYPEAQYTALAHATARAEAPLPDCGGSRPQRCRAGTQDRSGAGLRLGPARAAGRRAPAKALTGPTTASYPENRPQGPFGRPGPNAV